MSQKSPRPRWYLNRNLLKNPKNPPKRSLKRGGNNGSKGKEQPE
jgi:hypothetical protein